MKTNSRFTAVDLRAADRISNAFCKSSPDGAKTGKFSKRCGVSCSLCPMRSLCDALDLTAIEIVSDDDFAKADGREFKLTFVGNYCRRFYFFTLSALFAFVMRVPINMRGYYFVVEWPDGHKFTFDVDFVRYAYSK